MNLQTKLRQLQGGFLSVNRQIVPAPTSKVAYLKQNELKLRLENKACASKKADVNFLGSYRALKVNLLLYAFFSSKLTLFSWKLCSFVSMK